jgi:hypothetical protein
MAGPKTTGATPPFTSPTPRERAHATPVFTARCALRWPPLPLPAPRTTPTRPKTPTTPEVPETEAPEGLDETAASEQTEAPEVSLGQPRASAATGVNEANAGDAVSAAIAGPAPAITRADVDRGVSAARRFPARGSLVAVGQGPGAATSGLPY